MVKQAPSNEPFADESDADAVAAEVAAASTKTDVAVKEPRMTDVVLPDGSHFKMADVELKQLTFADLADIPVSDANEALGEDQFGPILEDKGKLVGVPLIVLAWTFNEGDMGTFTSMLILTQNDRRFIVNDGSTGICSQLQALTARTGQTGMLACPRGFTVSEYDKELPNGKVTRAKTFYIEAQQRVS